MAKKTGMTKEKKILAGVLATGGLVLAAGAVVGGVIGTNPSLINTPANVTNIDVPNQSLTLTGTHSEASLSRQLIQNALPANVTIAENYEVPKNVKNGDIIVVPVVGNTNFNVNGGKTSTIRITITGLAPKNYLTADLTSVAPAFTGVYGEGTFTLALPEGLKIDPNYTVPTTLKNGDTVNDVRIVPVDANYQIDGGTTYTLPSVTVAGLPAKNYLTADLSSITPAFTGVHETGTFTLTLPEGLQIDSTYTPSTTLKNGDTVNDIRIVAVDANYQINGGGDTYTLPVATVAGLTPKNYQTADLTSVVPVFAGVHGAGTFTLTLPGGLQIDPTYSPSTTLKNGDIVNDIRIVPINTNYQINGGTTYTLPSATVDGLTIKNYLTADLSSVAPAFTGVHETGTFTLTLPKGLKIDPTYTPSTTLKNGDTVDDVRIVTSDTNYRINGGTTYTLLSVIVSGLSPKNYQTSDLTSATTTFTGVSGEGTINAVSNLPEGLQLDPLYKPSTLTNGQTIQVPIVPVNENYQINGGIKGSISVQVSGLSLRGISVPDYQLLLTGQGTHGQTTLTKAMIIGLPTNVIVADTYVDQTNVKNGQEITIPIIDATDPTNMGSVVVTIADLSPLNYPTSQFSNVGLVIAGFEGDGTFTGLTNLPEGIQVDPNYEKPVQLTNGVILSVPVVTTSDDYQINGASTYNIPGIEVTGLTNKDDSNIGTNEYRITISGIHGQTTLTNRMITGLPTNVVLVGTPSLVVQANVKNGQRITVPVIPFGPDNTDSVVVIIGGLSPKNYQLTELEPIRPTIAGAHSEGVFTQLTGLPEGLQLDPTYQKPTNLKNEQLIQVPIVTIDDNYQINGQSSRTIELQVQGLTTKTVTNAVITTELNKIAVTGDDLSGTFDKTATNTLLSQIGVKLPTSYGAPTDIRNGVPFEVQVEALPYYQIEGPTTFNIAITWLFDLLPTPTIPDLGIQLSGVSGMGTAWFEYSSTTEIESITIQTNGNDGQGTLTNSVPYTITVMASTGYQFEVNGVRVPSVTLQHTFTNLPVNLQTIPTKDVSVSYQRPTLIWSDAPGQTPTATTNVPLPTVGENVNYVVDSPTYTQSKANTKIGQGYSVRLRAKTGYQFENGTTLYEYTFYKVNPYKISRSVDSIVSSTDEEKTAILDFFKSKHPEVSTATLASTTISKEVSSGTDFLKVEIVVGKDTYTYYTLPQKKPSDIVEMTENEYLLKDIGTTNTKKLFVPYGVDRIIIANNQDEPTRDMIREVFLPDTVVTLTSFLNQLELNSLNRLPESWTHSNGVQMYQIYDIKNAVKSSIGIGINVMEGVSVIPDDYWTGNLIFKEVNLPSTIRTIGHRAFQYSRLTSITLPEGLTSLGWEVFKRSPLTSLTLPSSLSGAFYFTFEAFVGDRVTDNSQITLGDLNRYQVFGQGRVLSLTQTAAAIWIIKP